MFIKKAAILFSNGEVLEGRAYAEIAILARKMGLTENKIYGFVTSSDKFVSPEEAAEIATESGQVNDISNALTPDMLWPVRD